MSDEPLTNTQPQKKTVFESNGDVYRIPALIYEGESKTLLAFAEKRRTPDDADVEKLVMKTGKVKEESSGKTTEWSELKPVEKTRICGYRPMNPCPVYDKVNKKLFLFFIRVKGTVSEQWQKKYYCNKARLCYITSTDLGETWSEVTDLTDRLDTIKDWATFAVGPGHGIQTKDGRLIVPLYAYYSSCIFCIFPCLKQPNPYALSLYCDVKKEEKGKEKDVKEEKDEKEEWKFGKMFETISVECEMAEVYDDNGSSFIYCNARNVKGYRVEAVSNNNGGEFCTHDSNLPERNSGCQGSVVSFPAQPESTNTESDPSHNPNKWLLFTHPTNSLKNEGETRKSDRNDLGVYLNKSPHDPNAEWSKPWIINDGPSGYSDLAYIGNGWFTCLFECGKEKIHEQIVSVVFRYDEVEQGIGK